MSKGKKLTYDRALEELQSLLDQLQSENIPIDELTEKIARAKELISFCRDKLRQTETEVEGLLGDE